MEDIIGEFAIGIKHFKVTTKADNIFEEEQTSQIAKVVLLTPTVVEAPFNPNKVDHEATADLQSEILII